MIDTPGTDAEFLEDHMTNVTPPWTIPVFNQHIGERNGFCLACWKFTTLDVELEARGVKCSDCGELRVVGAKEVGAAIMEDDCAI